MKLKSSAQTLLSVLALSGLLIGCDRTKPAYSSSASNTDSMVDTNMVITNEMGSTNRNMDNSGLNTRDRDTNNLTPGDQGNSADDIDLTQRIRKGLMDSTYSVNAKNIKIITVNGQVTLRGPVDSDSEKTGIESLAKGIAGDSKVNNQLEVKSN